MIKERYITFEKCSMEVTTNQVSKLLYTKLIKKTDVKMKKKTYEWIVVAVVCVNPFQLLPFLLQICSF